MTGYWFHLVDDRPGDALAATPAWDRNGVPAGWLAAWPAGTEPAPGAAKIDARAIDSDGDEAWVSLVLAPPDAGLPFDDPSVSQAIRMSLRMPAVDLRSTLVLGDDRFAGALTGMHDAEPGLLTYDPFAVLFPARLLRVGPGLLGRMPAPVGPSMQRYGSANPWPWDRFS